MIQKIMAASGKTFTCQFRKNNLAKHLRLSVHADGRVTVTLPRYTSFKIAQQFVSHHTAWIYDMLEKLKKRPVGILREQNEKQYQTLKMHARKLVDQRLAHFNQFYGFPIGKISIRNQCSRWGSCSSQGNLNFNYKIVLLSPELQDYLVVHELCHLKEMNHSTRFWALVGKTIPEYRFLAKKLRSM